MRPLPPSAPVELTRRTVLTGASVATGCLATGCTLGPERDGSGAQGPPAAFSESAQPDPDVALAVDALAAEQAALAAIQGTLERHHRLRETLAPMLVAHRAHVSLLAQAAPKGSPSSATSSPSGASPAPFRVRSGGGEALRSLSEMELGLTTSTKRGSFAAESGAFARLLASMAAASAQHSALLLRASSRPGSSKRRGS